MAAQYYTLADLKSLALLNAQRFRPEYVSGDVDKAYNYSVARCGFENPEAVDTDYVFKQFWLIELMNLYFYYDIDRQYLLKFDVEGLKLGQIAKNVKETIRGLEERFAKAKGDVNTAHLFLNAEDYFASIVVDGGITDDAIGQYYKKED